MKKLFFNLNLLSLLVIFLFIVSCNKENEDTNLLTDEFNSTEALDFTMEDMMYSFAELEPEEVNNIEENAMIVNGKPRCFTFIFPIDIDFPDGSTITVNSREEFKGAIQEWRQNNPDSSERPMIVFPVDVTLRDGTIKTINNPGELKTLLKRCFKIKKHIRIKRCFKPVYPLTLLYPDGTTLELNSRVDLKNAIIEWKENNPNSEEHPEIQFPFDVELRGGKTITINNKNDLRKLMRRCMKLQRKHRKR